MMLSLDTAYRSFGGEVEASSIPTICRLPDSRRHQLLEDWFGLGARVAVGCGPDAISLGLYSAFMIINDAASHVSVAN